MGREGDLELLEDAAVDLAEDEVVDARGVGRVRGREGEGAFFGGCCEGSGCFGGDGV